MSFESNPFFLKKKYGDLHTSIEVTQAAHRTETRIGEKVSQDPATRIQNYLDRFKEITDRKNPDERERGVEAIKRLLYRGAIIKPENIPDSYWEGQRRMAREQGHGNIDVTEDVKKQQAEILITDQKSTLDNWIDYLASEDAVYPDWLKYWTVRNVIGMGEFDKEKKAFTRRSKGTVKPFPDINREALAYVLDAVTKKYAKQQINLAMLEEDDKKRFDQLLKEESFPKLYAWAIEKVTPASVELLTITEGKWIKYQKGTDHMPLVESLQGHGTGWCTAGESTAASQLGAGDFYVYYSHDEKGNPRIPRAAIRMQGDGIAEVRGIAPDQNLDPYIGDVVQKKMTEFPDGKAYEKKAGDMKQLTMIEKKVKTGNALNKDELTFLYEIHHKIDGFGYQRDPRVNELQSQRNPQVDMPVVFECEQKQIARSQKEVNEFTKAYVGPMFPGIFKALGHLEHVYTSFPEGKITRYNIEIGGQSEEQLEATLERAGMKISGYGLHMMKQKEFKTAKDPEQMELVRLTISGLFNDQNAHTTDDIYKKAEELGLELCPAEVGPHLRLHLKDQPMGEWLRIAMKQIAVPDGDPSVFRLVRVGGGLWLNYDWASPAYEWHPRSEFVFRLRK